MPEKTPTPRVRQAMRLYATGVARTKAEAARAVGIGAGTLGRWMRDEPQLARDMDHELHMETLSTSRLLDFLGRKAVMKIAHIMDNAQSERTALEAARDLADRGRETSKIQRQETTKLELNAEDVAKLSESLVRTAEARSEFTKYAQGEHVSREAQIDDLTRVDA